MNRTYRHGLTDMSRFARRVLGAGALLSGAALVAAGCSSAAATDPASSSSSEALAGTGPLSSSEILGATACASTLTATYTGSTTYLAYSFPGIKGESVDIWVRGSAGADAEAWLLRSDFTEVASNDNASTGILDSNILSLLTKTETYYVAFKEKHGKEATFNVALTCGGTSDGGTEAGTDAGGGTDAGQDSGSVDAGPQCPTKCISGQTCVSGACEYLSCTGLQVPGDYATIMGALAVIPAGGTICLAAQNYPEAVTVSATGPVVIQGISSALSSIASVTATTGQLTLTGVDVAFVTSGGNATVAASAMDDLFLTGTGTVTDSAIDSLNIGGSATVTGSTTYGVNVDITNGTVANVLLDGVEALNGAQVTAGVSSGTLNLVVQNSYLTGGFAVSSSALPSAGSIALLNNTLVGSGSGTGMYFDGAGTTSIQYFNNIIENFNVGIDVEGTVGATASGDNALFNLTNRYAGTAVAGPGYVLTSPDLDTNTPPGLLSGSPCVGAGAAAHAPTTDFWGNARNPNQVDIGAVSGPAGGPRALPPVENFYSQAFAQGVTPTTQCTAWQSYQSALTGNYGTVTLGGSNSTTMATCTGASANTICQALHTNGTVSALSCGGHTWYVGTCGSGTEVSADNTLCACGTTGFTARPCIGNDNWGGVEGTTCDAPGQTLTVTCE